MYFGYTICKYLVPVSRQTVLLKVSLAVQKPFGLIRSCMFIFFFCLPDREDISKQRKKKVAKSDVKERSTFVFLSRTFMASGLIFVFNSFWLYFCLWGETVVQFDSFTCNCPIFPTPFIEEDDFTPILYILASFASGQFPI